MILSRSPGYPESDSTCKTAVLYKVCGQSYHDVIIKKLHKGHADFWTMRTEAGKCKVGQYRVKQ
jgi:hypothetical protein